MTADQATHAPVDVDTLPPTQYLILEVLAARHRTGEALWTFPKRLAPQMRALERAGLIGWKGGVAPATVQAWLTDAGRAAALMGGYVTPAAADAERMRALLGQTTAALNVALDLAVPRAGRVREDVECIEGCQEALRLAVEALHAEEEQ